VLRVQQNTLEQLVFFLPLLWLFSFYVSVVGIGVVRSGLWVALFMPGDTIRPRADGGFSISSISGMVLLLGSLFGIILSLVRPEN